MSDTWFFIYAFLFIGAYVQDCLDFIFAQGTFRRWWSDQRMWLIRGVTSYLFGLIEFVSKGLGIATHGFNVTSKVVDDEQGKRYCYIILFYFIFKIYVTKPYQILNWIIN